MKFSLILLLLLTANSSGAAERKEWTIDLGQCQSSIEFRAQAIPVLHILGKFQTEGKTPLTGNLRIQPEALSGAATLGLNSCDTGVPRQTALLKKHYFEIDKWPEAHFQFSPMPLPPTFWVGAKSAMTALFKGTLALKGKENSISGTADVARDGEKEIDMQFRFPVTMVSHGIPPIEFLGVTVSDTVDVLVDIRAPLPDGKPK